MKVPERASRTLAVRPRLARRRGRETQSPSGLRKRCLSSRRQRYFAKSRSMPAATAPITVKQAPVAIARSSQMRPQDNPARRSRQASSSFAADPHPAGECPELHLYQQTGSMASSLTA
eukprot:9493387-Pyramimonas_sp.AAC.5